MKILDLKKVTIILVTMLLFLSMQISVFASDNCTVVKIPVKQLFDNEVEGIADEFSYIMTTDQSDAPMPAGGRNMQYSWTMKKNAATEITLNVKTAGQYHYTLCQTTDSPVMGYFLLLFGSLICLSILTYESQRRNKRESQDEA